MSNRQLINDELNPIIDYLKNTSEDSWCTDWVKRPGGKNCLFGHIFDLGGNELYNRFENIATTFMVYPINDGSDPRYPQDTPKQRCIAYLEDLLSGKEKTAWELWDEMDDNWEEIKKRNNL